MVRSQGCDFGILVGQVRLNLRGLGIRHIHLNASNIDKHRSPL